MNAQPPIARSLLVHQPRPPGCARRCYHLRMPAETRHIDHRYFEIEASIVGRTETRCGDFDSYDGHIKTTGEQWWRERDGQKSKLTLTNIEQLIARHSIEDPDGLAAIFTDSRKYARLPKKTIRTSLILMQPLAAPPRHDPSTTPR